MALLILLIFLLPHYLSSEWSSENRSNGYFVVWNVGQGQWTTRVSESECLHFDIGGERKVIYQATELCHGKTQKIFLSHWDWDHIGFVKKYAALNPTACLALSPVGPTTPRKQDLIAGISSCESKTTIIYHGQIEKKSNDESHVVWTDHILVPGDSTIQKEQVWAGRVPIDTFGLVLGHHGSRSSTGEYLFQHLPKLKWAVSSARFARYRHPHIEVIRRLKQHHVPLLRTEDWGTLVFFQ